MTETELQYMYMCKTRKVSIPLYVVSKLAIHNLSVM